MSYKTNFKLNKEQQRAVLHKDGPALILAVPGAGKTTVLIHRTKNLISNHNINPYRILSITFSKQSSIDMKNRFYSTFDDVANVPIKFSTIHSFSYSILREGAYRYNQNYTFIESKQSPINKNKLLRNLYWSINREYATEERIEGISNSIGYIKNMMMSVDEFMEISDEFPYFKDIFYQYENYKREHNLIDFDDMLTLSFDFLKRDKYLLNKYRAKYDYIQVDEGQDTSKIQIELIKLIAHPKNNLFVVADDDQSIYGFRGAYPSALIDFKKVYPDAKIFYMEENFRSSENIVSVCNSFIKQNTIRYDKDLFTKNNSLYPITVVKLNNLIDEYNYIIEKLKNDKDFSDTAILFRNNISSIGLIESLEKNDIPFYIRDAKVHFFNHWITHDIICFLNLAYDNTDLGSFENIYYKMKGFIMKDFISFAKTQDYNKSVFDRILKYPGLKDYQREKIEELKFDFKKLSKLKPYDAISFIQYDLKYEKYLQENCIKFGYTIDSLKTILFYLKFIASHTKTMDEFFGRLKYLDYMTKKGAKNKNKNAITLSTIHSAKGLEFENVYMIDLIDGEFPTGRSVEKYLKHKDLGELEEERRLFYVGMTRAKKRLELLTIKYKNDKEVEPSKFLVELEELSKQG